MQIFRVEKLLVCVTPFCTQKLADRLETWHPKNPFSTPGLNAFHAFSHASRSLRHYVITQSPLLPTLKSLEKQHFKPRKARYFGDRLKKRPKIEKNPRNSGAVRRLPVFLQRFPSTAFLLDSFDTRVLYPRQRRLIIWLHS